VLVCPAKGIYGLGAALLFPAWPASGIGAVFSKAVNRRQASAVVSVAAVARIAREFIAQTRRRFSAVSQLRPPLNVEGKRSARGERSCFPLCLQVGILAPSTQGSPSA
jgi:hypothetical protein